MPIEQFDLARSMVAASSLANTTLSLQKYANETKRKNEIRDARGDALEEGTPEAIRALIKLDPATANATIQALSSMDKRSREQVKQQSEQTARQMMWVEQGTSPEEKSQRFDEMVNFMVEQTGKEEHKKYLGKYSPDLTQNWIMKAMTVDDINEQFAFGQLKVAEKDGKAVYIHSNPAGQTRVAPVPEGVQPTQKEFAGTSKGGGAREFKPSDANANRAAAASLYGGTWDPATNRISGIERGQERNALAIAARADEITRKSREDGQELGANEAVAQAARELKIDVPKLGPTDLQGYLDQLVGPK